MYIKNIKLQNYRNYKNVNINFDKNINIIYGKNAQGKTNILESIYLTSTTKSHKNVKENEIINFNEEESHIQVLLNKQEKDYTIDLHLKRNKNKGIAVNKIPIKKTADFVGAIKTVIFSPEDLKLVKEGPSQRRKYIDVYAMQTDRYYTYNIIRYNKILNQRNKLLREVYFNKDTTLLDTISLWDEELIKHGIEIIKKRRNIIKELQKKILEKSYYISNKNEKLYISYEENVLENDFSIKLKENIENDIKKMQTSVGPHRDDIKFVINDVDIRKFGSQGQQKTAALCLKLSELESIKEKTEETPILLLDDVFSEIDETRQKLLIDNIKNTQTIITATGIEKNIFTLLKPQKIFEVKDNQVFQKQ